MNSHFPNVSLQKIAEKAAKAAPVGERGVKTEGMAYEMGGASGLGGLQGY